MEEETIITAVRPAAQRTIGESLHLEFLHVSFRMQAASKYREKIKRTTLKALIGLPIFKPQHRSMATRWRMENSLWRFQKMTGSKKVFE